MSQTRTILSYIYQNSPHVAPISFKKEKTVPPRPSQTEPIQRPLSRTGNRLSNQRVPLSDRSFFNQCTDATLKESKNSIRDGVRYSVRDYYSYEHMRYNSYRLYHAEAQPASISEQSPDTPVFITREQTKSPSILVKKDVSSRDVLVKTFMEVMPICLQKKLGLKPEYMTDPTVLEAINYATNVFLQAFKSASTRELCYEFMQGSRSGDLKEALADLAYDFMDKYEELALEHFEDTVFEYTTHAGSITDGCSTENPGLYRSFGQIWKLDRPSLLEFDVHTFIAEYSGSDSHPYSFNNFRELFMCKFGESAIKMNILRFNYTYRDQLHAENCSRTRFSPENLDEVPEFAILREAVQRLTELEENVPHKPNRKSLRFV